MRKEYLTSSCFSLKAALDLRIVWDSESKTQLDWKQFVDDQIAYLELCWTGWITKITKTLLHHGAPVQPFVRSLHPAIFGLALDPLQAVTFAAMAKSWEVHGARWRRWRAISHGRTQDLHCSFSSAFLAKELKCWKCWKNTCYELKNEVNMRWEGYSSELRDLFLSFGMRDELLAFELWQYSAFCSLQGGWLLVRYQSPTLLSMPCDLCVFASLWCPYAYTEAVSSNRRGSTRFSSSKLLLGQSLPENGGFFLKWVPGTTVDTIFDPFFIGFSINNPVFDWHLPILQLRHWIHIHDLINRLGVGMGVTILDTQWMIGVSFDKNPP